MRLSDIKSLVFGISIGAIMASILFALAFMLPLNNSLRAEAEVGFMRPIPSSTFTLTPTFEPSPTYTLTPTFLPSPTEYLSPTRTSTPSDTPTTTATYDLIENGEMLVAGPLTRDQQIKLYEASSKYVAPTYLESKNIIKTMGTVSFVDPSSICGPLSAAILQDAGILNHNVTPYDFYLLNPRIGKDGLILQKAFPEESFIHTRYETRLDEFDWRANPLMPGDFLYIFGGSGGNFEHMLVVTRMDDGGRAYSVTNFNTKEGFIIDEVMLYDPYRLNTGIFYTWTERPDSLLGSTGFTAFEVWRMK